MTRKVSRPKPLEEYLQMQGRFRGVSAEQTERLKTDITERYNELMAVAEGQG